MKKFLGALALSTLAACGGGGGGGGAGGGTGTLSVEITDAFLPLSQVAEARVTIDELRVHPQASANGGFLTIYSGPPIDVDLVQLQNGVTRLLVQAQVPAATYRQLRVVISDAYLRLANGNEYRVADGSLHLTSQSTSGFKVFVDPEVQVLDGFSHTLLLDVDLSRTFRPMPANDPLNATTYSLHPVLRAANLSGTGELRGVVERDDGSGTLVGVDGAMVFVLPPGEPDPANAVATTGTASDGSWAVLGLAPGTYDVLADDLTSQARSDAHAVLAGSATVVDLVLP